MVTTIRGNGFQEQVREAEVGKEERIDAIENKWETEKYFHPWNPWNLTPLI